MVYKMVETKQEEEAFKRIWSSIRDAYNFGDDDSIEGDKHLILHDGEYVGTIEFIPYFPGNGSTIDNSYSFHKLAENNRNPKGIIQIEKVAILPEFQSHNVLDSIICAILEYCIMNNVEYYIAFMVPKFFRSLRISYHFPVKKLAITEDKDKGNKFYTMMFNCKYLFDNVDNFAWYTNNKEKQLKTREV